MTPAPDSNATSFWSFDNHTLDDLAGFHGTPVGNLTYKSPGINGYGSALSIDPSRNEFVEVKVYRNLAQRSFTVEMWFYCTNLTNNNYGLFQQNQYPNKSHSLHYQIRNNKTFLGFYINDVSGSIEIKIDTWYHVAFVYDFSSSNQIIYLNGVLDGIKGFAQAYQGTSGSINIGRTAAYFSG